MYTWGGEQSLLWFRHANSEEMLFAESQVEREREREEREREREIEILKSQCRRIPTT